MGDSMRRSDSRGHKVLRAGAAAKDTAEGDEGEGDHRHDEGVLNAESNKS